MKGFRRSVDDVGDRRSDKNIIFLKIVDDEGVPRIEIKLRATNGYSKKHRSSEIKLNNKTKNEKLNFYIQVDNKTVLNDLPVEPSHSNKDLNYDYQVSESSVRGINENDYLHNEATFNINGSLLNELHDSLLTSDSEANTISYDHTTYTTHQKSNINSNGLINNLTMFASKETDAIETATIKSAKTHNINLPQSGSTKVIITPPEVSNADHLLQNVDKYRKIYSHAFYQRDKSVPDVAEGVSQVTSDFLLHFLPLVASHALPRSVNLINNSNVLDNENFETSFEENNNLLKSSPTIDKNITISSINTITSLPHSDYEQNNIIKMNHSKICNTTNEYDFENIFRDSTTATDIFKITFLIKDLSGALMRFSTPNMTRVTFTPLVTNLHESKYWPFSNSDEINYNVTPTTSMPRVEKDVKEGFPKGNNTSILSKKHKNVIVEDVAAPKTMERPSKNFNMFNNEISTKSVSHLINGTTLKFNDIRKSWLDYKSDENKTLRKLGRRHSMKILQ